MTNPTSRFAAGFGSLALGAATLLGVSAFSSNAEAADYISCPLDKARRTITNELPRGWWTTPIASSLSDTRIQVIGGKRTLICVYGSAGSIQRHEPRGETCRTVPRGFRCVADRPAPPRTFSTGAIEVPQTYAFDLDRGIIGTGAKADIWFQAATPVRMYLTPRNGAKIAVGDRSNRGLSGCERAAYSTGKVALHQIPEGSYVCVKTNEGRISQFRMNGINAGYPKKLKIGYTTWANR